MTRGTSAKVYCRRGLGTFVLSTCDECGGRRVVRKDSLRATCHRCTQKAKATKHGYTSKRKESPTYITWRSMRRRCNNEKHVSFADYGGRGVTVCAAWDTSFEAFLGDMGERPEGMTLDRIDPHGNYEPGNCRWATRAEQNRNKRCL